jgi:hypothetical protein
MKAMTICHRALSAAPRSHLFTVSRTLTSSARLRKDNDSSSSFSFKGTPAPPRLPKEEQDIFEYLQRQSTGAFSTPRQAREPPRINQSPDASPTEKFDAQSIISERVEKISSTTSSSTLDSSSSADPGPSKIMDLFDKTIKARGEGEELHPNVRRGATPEFEGDTNPKTGEIGGPKNDPLRWEREWTYNGRATDF